jgi:enoyl-CoA hydratase/carnithine racemase
MLNYHVVDEVACITLDRPPVNSLDLALRRALIEAFRRAEADFMARAVVLHGNGRGFCAGGDIGEFGTPAASAAPALSADVHPVIEGMRKPVVAAIHGFAVGGGLETALVCHYRVVEADARIGLPEVKLGTIPLSGTQRLPRLMSLSRTVDMIMAGEIAQAERLAGTAMFDRVVAPGAALSSALELARHADGLPLVRHRPLAADDGALATARRKFANGTAAQRSALDAIAGAYAAADFDSGMLHARSLYNTLMAEDTVTTARDRFLAGDRTDPADDGDTIR